MKDMITMGEFIIQRQADFPYAQGELSRLLSSLKLAAKVMNSQINKAGLVDSILGSMGSQNIQGEEQKKLDLYANDLFIKALKARNEVCGIASEEEERFVMFENESGMNGKYVVLIDPIDGSSNIEVNVSIGTIFTIYRRVTPVGTPATLEDFLQSGEKQVAAGYIIFGSSTMMVFTTGKGVNGFTYDPNIGVFYLSHPDIKIPKDGGIYSVNEGNYEYFAPEVKAYINYCKTIDADSNRPYTGRYIGSMIADFHRNLLKGGIYMYPASSDSPQGKLRLLYECNPMAYLMEQAGGAATDGTQRIMEIAPQELHERTPLFVGSTNMVEKVKSFIKKEQ